MMHVGGSVNFDFDSSIASLLDFKKKNCSTVKFKANKIIDVMDFNTIKIQWKIISGIKDIGKDGKKFNFRDLICKKKNL